MIEKQQAKKENTNPLCFYAVEKYKKMERVNRQNDYKIMSRKWADIKKTRPVLCVL